MPQNIAWNGHEANSTYFSDLREWARKVFMPAEANNSDDWTQGDPYNVWIDRGATLMLVFKPDGSVSRTLRVTNKRIRLVRGLWKDTPLSGMKLSGLVTKEVVVQQSIRECRAIVQGKPIPKLPDPVIPLGQEFPAHEPEKLAFHQTAGTNKRPGTAKETQRTEESASTVHHVAENKPKKNTPIREYQGVLLGYGYARVRPDDPESRCFYVDVKDRAWGETRCWGKELESALSKSGAKNGELVLIGKWGKVACLVPKKVRNPDGTFEEIEVPAHRNKWTIDRLR